MKRSIFIGSSSEALEQARRVGAILQSMGDVNTVLWTDVFNPGELTLEALEDMLRRCSAAVFIVTADDKAIVRDRQVSIPRTNVMLEFGLVAGRLGHQSAAVCEYGSAELPSDLAGVTVIHMDLPPEGTGFHWAPEDSLKQWCSRLLATAPGIPRTEIVHGYAGRWHFDIDLHKWRGVTITRPGYVTVNGYLDLYFPATGDGGRGMAHGTVTFHLLPEAADKQPFMGVYKTAHDVRNAVCGPDGSLVLTTEAFAVQKDWISGPAPVELADLALITDPWSAHWSLVPKEASGLAGKVESQGGIVTEGDIVATKSAG